jgi:hypothetical protein
MSMSRGTPAIQTNRMSWLFDIDQLWGAPAPGKPYLSRFVAAQQLTAAA